MNKDHFKVFDFGLDKAQFLKDARRIQNKINKNYADIDEQATYPTYQNYQKVLLVMVMILYKQVKLLVNLNYQRIIIHIDGKQM